MFWKNNQEKKKEVKITLQGCLDESKDVELCRHGYGGYCWHCVTGNEPTQEKDEDPFESNSFKTKLG